MYSMLNNRFTHYLFIYLLFILFTSGLFIANAMWTHWHVLSKMQTIKLSHNFMFTFSFVLR